MREIVKSKMEVERKVIDFLNTKGFEATDTLPYYDRKIIWLIVDLVRDEARRETLKEFENWFNEFVLGEINKMMYDEIEVGVKDGLVCDLGNSFNTFKSEFKEKELNHDY